ncbi:MAG: type II secretion system F family protein [Firmicutes bacterium]|nr:type II secretion system F family protein [Bacillota bacterium]
MPQFIFTAQDKSGVKSSGTIEASDQNAALQLLSERDLIVTKLTPMHQKQKGIPGVLNIGGLKLSGEELLAFTQQFASLLDAGVSIRKAVGSMLEDSENATIREILYETNAGLNEGKSLSDIFRSFPTVFSTTYVSMISAGEAGGKLPYIMFKLADYIENTENIKNRVYGSLYYPVTILIFAFTIMCGILIFGIPVFKDIYAGFSSKLPAPTQFFIDVSDFFGKIWIYAAIVLIIGIVILKQFFNTSQGKIVRDTILLRIPVVGKLLQKLAISRFSRTLSVLYSSGVPLLTTMELVSGSIGNAVMEKVIIDAIKNWREGESIAEPLRRSKQFTSMAITMISTGEESGGLEKMMDKMANFYDTQVEVSLKALTSILEPIIMVFVGLFVGILIVVLGLPFLNISTVLGR